MPNEPNRAESRRYMYRYMANEYRRLAAEGCSDETRRYYLQMAESYRTLADTSGAEDREPVISDSAQFGAQY